jgi:hypothetical protein
VKLATAAVGFGAVMLSLSAGASAAPKSNDDSKSPSVAALANSSISHQAAQLRASQAALGVDKATQEKLVVKLFVLGQRLDADIDANLVSEQVWTAADGLHTRGIYADGSRSEMVVQQPTPTGEIKPLASGPSVSGCQASTSRDVRSFDDCSVKMTRPTYNFSLDLSYEYRQFGCYITISDAASGGAGIDAGNEKIKYVTRSSQAHTGICHAKATVKQNIGVGGVGFNSTVGIGVKVQSSSTWTNKLNLYRIDE